MNQNSRIRSYTIKGFSIVEMLISMALLSIVMVVTTQSITGSLKNSKKSDSIAKNRENVDYAISTIERLLRNAQSATCSPDNRTLNYIDEFGNSTLFRCDNANSLIASGSGAIRLTSTDVDVICNDPAALPFQCTAPSIGVPASVTVNIKAQETNLGGSVEGSVITSKTKILLRNYTVF